MIIKCKICNKDLTDQMLAQMEGKIKKIKCCEAFNKSNKSK